MKGGYIPGQENNLVRQTYSSSKKAYNRALDYVVGYLPQEHRADARDMIGGFEENLITAGKKAYDLAASAYQNAPPAAAAVLAYNQLRARLRGEL